VGIEWQYFTIVVIVCIHDNIIRNIMMLLTLQMPPTDRYVGVSLLELSNLSAAVNKIVELWYSFNIEYRHICLKIVILAEFSILLILLMGWTKREPGLLEHHT